MRVRGKKSQALQVNLYLPCFTRLNRLCSASHPHCGGVNEVLGLCCHFVRSSADTCITSDARVLRQPMGKSLQELDMELMGKRRKINPGVSSSAHISPSNGRTSVSWRRGSRHAETGGERERERERASETSARRTWQRLLFLPVRSPALPRTGRGAHTDLDRAAEGKATRGISMKDDHIVPSVHPGGRHLRMLAYPPAKVQDGPSSAVSVNKKRQHHTSPPCCVLCVFSKERCTLGKKDRMLFPHKPWKNPSILNEKQFDSVLGVDASLHVNPGLDVKHLLGDSFGCGCGMTPRHICRGAGDPCNLPLARPRLHHPDHCSEDCVILPPVQRG
ncbi:unnamed protein product [Pleuronectes platessa]|uniref:Uncharacterized protein n=1 Tax=Pleuronectes platessa TaxID=8262 RepID=A0A9N7W1P5_PLEPL|nr:unnamed protein product [Pleuronectes platessa]